MFLNIVLDVWNNIVNFLLDTWYGFVDTTFNFSTVKSTYTSVINEIILVFTILLAYRTLFIIIGFFGRARKYPECPENKKYAVIIAARNEEVVIGNLIKSIKNQTYNQENITIFIVADNCTDKTAEIARSLGAIVYERFDKEHVSKGFAIEFLIDNINRDYGVLSFDYFCIFDADNLLKNDFFHQINNALVSKNYDACTSFRNIKNFDSNVISASYGIHFYRNTLIGHRPRSILNLTTNATGTGYAIKSSFFVNGWHYTNLTEDAEFSIRTIAQDMIIGYCEAAEIYDEQPTSLKVAFKQRIRWDKGRLICFIKHCHRLITRLFTKKNRFFGKYDMYMYFFPYNLVSFFLPLSIQIFTLVYSLANTGTYDPTIFLKYLAGFLIGGYVGSILLGLLVVIKERKKIHSKWYRMILYLILWPWFDIVSLPITLIAIVKPVKWKPIIHKDTTSIEDIEKKDIRK